MKQQNRFWIALILITLVCFVDYQFFIEGYTVRDISPFIRQLGHLTVLIVVIPIGYWAWKKHPITFYKKLWLTAYIAALAFVLLVGLLKTQTNWMSPTFYEWTATVRYVFCSPLPLLLIYMLSHIASQSSDTQ